MERRDELKKFTKPQLSAILADLRDENMLSAAEYTTQLQYWLVERVIEAETATGRKAEDVHAKLSGTIPPQRPSRPATVRTEPVEGKIVEGEIREIDPETGKVKSRRRLFGAKPQTQKPGLWETFKTTLKYGGQPPDKES